MSIRHPVWPCIMLATDQINCVPYAPICIRRLIQSNNEPRAQRMRRFSFATYPSKKKLSLEWCPLLIHLFFFFWIVDFLCFLSFSVKSFLVDRNVLLEKLFFFLVRPIQSPSVLFNMSRQESTQRRILWLNVNMRYISARMIRLRKILRHHVDMSVKPPSVSSQ
jgi:hypothetical protein